jgi:hypothetical protein
MSQCFGGPASPFFMVYPEEEDISKSSRILECIHLFDTAIPRVLFVVNIFSFFSHSCMG